MIERPEDLGDGGTPGLRRRSMPVNILLSDICSIEARVDAPNFTNHPSVVSINTIVNGSSYGLPINMQPMRTLSATVRFRF